MHPILGPLYYSDGDGDDIYWVCFSSDWCCFMGGISNFVHNTCVLKSTYKLECQVI